ncbi:MAG: 6-phosphogluconolactonase [Planctomycetes bacterium]|nr:6-phosphogluconolactonase [Planctomycetota bacterium]
MSALRAQIDVVADAAAAVPLLLDEVRGALVPGQRPLLGFATGATFAPFLAALGAAMARGELGEFTATHLDEYEGFAPGQRGGMVAELCRTCPPFLAMLQRGAFLPVPGDGEPRALGAHVERLRDGGGVALWFLGIGRNGHVAFNEPGTPFEVGFHTATLAAATRDDARARFAPDEPPRRAVTAGPATILAARRAVLCAFGAAKAPAVRAALHGPVTPSCPASVLQRHPNLRVVLDRAAAGELGREAP